MSHHIYQTKGFILDSSAIGEANMSFVIFTEELGLVRATAQGVRLQKSKLKPSLQKYSYSHLCLVKGKEVWRLTNADKIASLYDSRLPLGTKKILINILSFIQRMIVGEGKNLELFEILKSISAFCFKNSKYINQSSYEEVPDRVSRVVIVLAKFKILNCIGYGLDKNNIIYEYYLKEMSKEIIDSLLTMRKDHLHMLERHIEEALSQSHL
jgi:DNA repair protein RecO